MYTTASVAAQVSDLKDFGAGHVAVVGGKAANLGELLRAGLPVPDGFVVTTDAYAAAAHRARLAELFADDTAQPTPRSRHPRWCVTRCWPSTFPKTCVRRSRRHMRDSVRTLQSRCARAPPPKICPGGVRRSAGHIPERHRHRAGGGSAVTPLRLEIGVSLLRNRFLIEGRVPDDQYVIEVVDDVLLPLFAAQLAPFDADRVAV